MKISIITVVYNDENRIEETIQSVVNQTYQNIEYIIIDGSSNDKTVEIINKYLAQINLFISENDNGIIKASRNSDVQLDMRDSNSILYFA